MRWPGRSVDFIEELTKRKVATPFGDDEEPSPQAATIDIQTITISETAAANSRIGRV
jgi:hypothetical protein